jgi:hypothetical protein
MMFWNQNSFSHLEENPEVLSRLSRQAEVMGFRSLLQTAKY